VGVMADWTTVTSKHFPGLPLHDKIVISSRYILIVWTGSPAADLDNGHEVCECYIPIGDRQFPDGLMIVSRRDLETFDREGARDKALRIAREAITDFETRHRIAA
jgi:hypothetical protein